MVIGFDMIVTDCTVGDDMRHIGFRVTGILPPKKDGANSMWNKETEAPKLVALRLQGLRALGNRPPFSQEIRIKVTIHVGSPKAISSGDLDTFVAGICDGLMQAHPLADIHQLFCEPENAGIHPQKTIAIDDDSQIIEIHAKKLFGRAADNWYEVELAGE